MAKQGRNKASASTGGTANQRRNGVMRQKSQEVFESLKAIIQDSGDQETFDLLHRIERVEDAMRSKPLIVLQMLELAWQVREDPRICEVLKNASGQTAEHKEESLGPCDINYTGVIRAHLLGTSRLTIKRVEQEWVLAEVVSRQADYATRRKKLRRQPFGFLGDVFRSMFRLHPVFTVASVMRDSPKTGLYEALKKHLVDIRQFHLVDAYACFNRHQIEALGQHIRGLNDPDALKRLAEYDSRQLKALADCAWIFADTVLVHPQTSKKYIEQYYASVGDADTKNAAYALSGEILQDLVTHHETAVDQILMDTESAQKAVRALCVPMGKELWPTFLSPGDIKRVVRCPIDIVQGIGDFARHIPEDISAAFQNFENPLICRDLISIGLETFGADTMADWLNNSGAAFEWKNLPARFNDGFNYSRDGDSSQTKNLYDLQDEAKSIYRAIRTLCNDPTNLASAA